MFLNVLYSKYLCLDSRSTLPDRLRRWKPQEIASVVWSFAKSVWRFFIQNFGDLSNFVSEIDILVNRVNDFKFCVDLGLRISNFANLSISQIFIFSKILSKTIFANFHFFSKILGDDRRGDVRERGARRGAGVRASQFRVVQGPRFLQHLLELVSTGRFGSRLRGEPRARGVLANESLQALRIVLCVRGVGLLRLRARLLENPAGESEKGLYRFPFLPRGHEPPDHLQFRVRVRKVRHGVRGFVKRMFYQSGKFCNKKFFSHKFCGF